MGMVNEGGDVSQWIKYGSNIFLHDKAFFLPLRASSPCNRQPEFFMTARIWTGLMLYSYYSVVFFVFFFFFFAFF